MTANSILLVDDDKDYTQSLKRALIVKGIKENILTASTPLESIKILKYTYIVFRAHTRARILGFTRAYAPGLAAETPLESAPRLRIRPPFRFKKSFNCRLQNRGRELGRAMGGDRRQVR